MDPANFEQASLGGEGGLTTGAVHLDRPDRFLTGHDSNPGKLSSDQFGVIVSAVLR